VLTKYRWMTGMTRAGSKMLGVVTRNLLVMLGSDDVLGPTRLGEFFRIFQRGRGGR
jgi:hypothetical protein